MSKLGGLLGLKSSQPAARKDGPPQPEPTAAVVELDQELFSPIANQLGEENEVLRGLLAEVEYRLSELTATKEAMARLVEPVNKTMRALEIAKSEKLSLQTVLNSTRAAYGKLRNEMAAVEKRASALENECLQLQEDLALAQEYGRTLERVKSDQSSELNARRAEFTELHRYLQQQSCDLQAIQEENRQFQERLVATDKKVVELETELEAARHRLAQSDKECAVLQRSFDEAVAETGRLSRRLVEADNAVTVTQARLRQSEASRIEVEEERTQLSIALDEAKERYQNEIETMRARFGALQARAATSDKLLEETRQALTVRAEEVRTIERRLSEATAIRNTVEGKIGQIESGIVERDVHIRDLELARIGLVERNDALAKAVATRESAYNRAQERIHALEERIAHFEAELLASREAAEVQIDDLTTQLQRERLDRSIAEGALEAGRKDVARLMREIATYQQRPRVSSPLADQLPPDHLPPLPRLRSVA